MLNGKTKRAHLAEKFGCERRAHNNHENNRKGQIVKNKFAHIESWLRLVRDNKPPKEEDSKIGSLFYEGWELNDLIADTKNQCSNLWYLTLGRFLPPPSRR